jgi:hypothetical protein
MFNKRQYNILSERYFEILLGDFSSLLWMIGQAPLIAGLIILRWQSWQATETLYFVIALSAVWFGCINACREIAREAAVYQRERLFGLDIGAYLASKIKILSLIGLVEMALFYFLIHRYVDTDLYLFPAFVTLFALYFSGMNLGLLLSRWCRVPGRAVVAVPIVIIPQIVFSKFVLPENTLKGAAVKIEKLMVVKWGFEGLKASRKGEMVYGDYGVSMLILAVLTVVFILLTLFHLWFAEDNG